MAEGGFVTSVVERNGKKESVSELEAGSSPPYSSRVHSGNNKNVFEVRGFLKSSTT